MILYNFLFLLFIILFLGVVFLKKMRIVLFIIFTIVLTIYLCLIFFFLQHKEQFYIISHESTISKNKLLYTVPKDFKRNYKKVIIRIICKRDKDVQKDISTLNVLVKLSNETSSKLSKCIISKHSDSLHLAYFLPENLITSFNEIIIYAETPIDIVSIDLSNKY